MIISVLDASNYFRGLLLLIRKDRKTTDPEVDIMKRIGKALGFEKEFCENAIHEILDNPYIVDEPPHFSTKELAVKFLKDGLSLAFADKEIHPHEEHWLRAAAEKNDLDANLVTEELRHARTREGYPKRWEVDDLIVKYS